MSRRDDRLSLQQMFDHAREAWTLAAGRQRGDLDNDRLFHLAMTRLLEILGEAATRVSEHTRKQHSTIAWTGIIGLRNRLIHGYDEVDCDVLWSILQNDLSPLVAQLEAILSRE